ncbi:acyl carrier protein phosphodiesterase [Kushneria aurantia]|uniref:ACP phosphodiesterase n=1 Tax=Kushneria aurantia TaxID=504092 RepID=A0ABV6G3Z4_9GAMM|nr:ACP phosphodiesterase [Kushneria aurantia]
MNFLAHARLAQHGSDDFLFGNLIADGLKGPVPAGLALQTALGVRFHRRLDALIDRDAITRALHARAPRPQRRVTGIALDIVWDHFLARRQHDSALNERIYRLLAHREAEIPPRQQRLFHCLRQQRWLEAYADFDFTCHAVAGVGQRLSGRNLLAELTPWLYREYDLLEASFVALWPRMEDHARQQRGAFRPPGADS